MFERMRYYYAMLMGQGLLKLAASTSKDIIRCDCFPLGVEPMRDWGISLMLSNLIHQIVDDCGFFSRHTGALLTASNMQVFTHENVILFS